MLAHSIFIIYNYYFKIKYVLKRPSVLAFPIMYSWKFQKQKSIEQVGNSSRLLNWNNAVQL